MSWRTVGRGALGATAFIGGFVVTTTLSSCGLFYPCNCPTAGKLFESTGSTCDAASFDDTGQFVPLPFEPDELVVATSPEEVVFEYKVDNDSFRVVYAVSE